MEPVISVVVPVFQVEGYIGRMAQSLGEQTVKDFEVVLVDDASGDNAIEVAHRSLAQSAVPHTVIEHKSNRGVAAARNTGLAAARGKNHICVDPDDVLHPRFLERLLACQRNGGVPIALCNYRMLRDGREWRPRRGHCQILEREEVLLRFLKRSIRVVSPAILVDSEFARRNSLTYSQSISFGEDVHYIWRAIAASPSLTYTDAALYGYVRRQGSTMSASSIAKVLTGYHGLRELPEAMPPGTPYEVRRWLLSRWVLGALKSSAGMHSLADFLQLSDAMDYQEHCEQLQGFPDLRVRLLALLLLRRRNLFYQMMGGRRLNQTPL